MDEMSSVVIKRCPVCASIRSRTQGAIEALETDLGVQVRVEDGEAGEFTVLVDQVPVIQRTGQSLPSDEEVEAAVRNAAPAPVGV
jgi:hypothetical protein